MSAQGAAATIPGGGETAQADRPLLTDARPVAANRTFPSVNPATAGMGRKTFAVPVTSPARAAG